MKKQDIKNLNTFSPKKKLNDKFFNEKKKLIGNVRKAILEVAELFIDGLEVPRLKVKDIIFTGSLANYNWSKHSDVDIHILVDFSKLKINKDLLADYFAMKKEEWGNKHEELTIYNFPVEMYVQDVKEVHKASGQYSVMNNQWLVEPEEIKKEDSEFDEKYVEDKAFEFIKTLLDLKKQIEKETERKELRKLRTKLKNHFKDFKEKRANGLRKNGEYDEDNITYKVVRRNNYIKKYFDLINYLDNKIHSL